MSTRRKPVMLLILDGWGYSEAIDDNAIALAKCPNWRRIWAQAPHTLIRTDGPAVGLPDGQMGNSEVGHMNLGSGRIAYPELTRIELALADGSFFQHPVLNAAAAAAMSRDGRLHVLGLLSPGGVHSHEGQIHAMVRLAVQAGVREVCVHVFLDGRDTPPRSAMASLQALDTLCRNLGTARIATVGGRFYGMDRDQRWERVEAAYECIVAAQSALDYPSAVAALEAGYARGENDEFVLPSLIAGGARINDGDALVFMNFRADRARQLTRALLLPDFEGFVRSRRPEFSAFVSLTEYQQGLPLQVAFAPSVMVDTFAEVLSQHGLSQLRIAETEKYAHVSFFFSGGREAEWPGETRILVPSPKVRSYDLQPEMSCPEVTDQLIAAIDAERFDVIVCNLANPDMVGHTGNIAAAVAAVEAVDHALGRIEAAVLHAGGALLVTADHGNLEDMFDDISGQPSTQHTTNPVPLVVLGVGELTLREGGSLRDVAPTLLELLDLPRPDAMTGRSLLIAN
jgi:2,3-bisphosphoglycerate-independent phosphoglycerate mutase